MIYLIASIFCSTLIMLVFKWAERFEINRLQLIVINYFVAFSAGYLAFGNGMGITEILAKPWFGFAIILGFVFISCFNIIGFAIQEIGVGIITVANKMSLVVPVLFSLIFVGEILTLPTAIGIILALIAVYFASIKKTSHLNGIKYWRLPILVFIISGAVDTFIKYAQEYLIPVNEFGLFCTAVFMVAGIIGIPFFIYQQVKHKEFKLSKTIICGISLGIPNFGSIYFLMEALNSPNWESSRLFPINHIGVVLLATLSGAVLFNEPVSRINKIGVGLAVIAILLLSLYGG